MPWEGSSDAAPKDLPRQSTNNTSYLLHSKGLEAVNEPAHPNATPTFQSRKETSKEISTETMAVDNPTIQHTMLWSEHIAPYSAQMSEVGGGKWWWGDSVESLYPSSTDFTRRVWNCTVMLLTRMRDEKGCFWNALQTVQGPSREELGRQMCPLGFSPRLNIVLLPLIGKILFFVCSHYCPVSLSAGMPESQEMQFYHSTVGTQMSPQASHIFSNAFIQTGQHMWLLAHLHCNVVLPSFMRTHILMVMFAFIPQAGENLRGFINFGTYLFCE